MLYSIRNIHQLIRSLPVDRVFLATASCASESFALALYVGQPATCEWEQSLVLSELALRMWIRREPVAVYTNHSWLGGPSRVSTKGSRYIRVFVAGQPLLTTDSKTTFKAFCRQWLSTSQELREQAAGDLVLDVHQQPGEV